MPSSTVADPAPENEENGPKMMASGAIVHEEVEKSSDAPVDVDDPSTYEVISSGSNDDSDSFVILDNPENAPAPEPGGIDQCNDAKGIPFHVTCCQL